MKSIGATLFPLLLLGLLAALTYWLARTANFDESMKRAKARHDPDFVVEHFGIQRFNAAGELQNSLTAERMTHYPDNDSTEIASPVLDYYRPDQTPTRVTAQRAWLNHDGKEVRLMGKVRLVHQGTAEVPDTVLETSRLTVFPDDELAQGNVPVTISRGKSVVVGSGVEYKGKENLAVLKGRARGIFYRVQ